MASKGYPVPPTLPEETGCLLVFYPKDEGHFFSRALAGQITRMAHYWLWDTETEYAHEIGYLWAKHNFRTLQAWESLDCELAEIIESGEDMNINVNFPNQGGSCGCCCGGGQVSNPLNLDDPSLPEGSPTVPLSTPSSAQHEMTVSELCDLATYLATGYVSVFVNWNNNFEIIGTSITAIIQFIQGKLFDGAAPSVLTFPSILLSNLSALLTTSILAGVTQKASDAAQDIKDDLICAITTSTSAASAKKNWESVVASVKDTYGTTTYAFLWLVSQLWNWEEVLTPDVITVPSNYLGSVCDCGLNPPASVSGYQWRKAALLQDVQASPYTTSKVITDTGYSYQASIPTAATNWDTMIKAIKPALSPGETIVGFTLQIKESVTGGGINDPATGHVRLTGTVTAWEGATPWRNLIVSSGDGGVHVTALSAAAAFDQVDSVSSGTASQERTLTHYARVGTGQTPPGPLTLEVGEIYYAVKLP